MASIVRSERYICANIDQNNNKFWNINQYDDFSVTTQWGRVGEHGQSKTFNFSDEFSAESFFGKKCREKEHGSSSSNSTYVKQKTLKAVEGVSKISITHDLATVASSQITTNNADTIALVKELSKYNIHNILSSTSITYDDDNGLFKTPLGIVTQDGIDEARDLLITMSDYVTQADYDNKEFRKTISQYLMAIPQNIGRDRPDPRRLYPDLSAITAQNSILDALQGSLQTMLTNPPAPKDDDNDTFAAAPPPQLFDAKMLLVEDGKDIDRINKKYKSTLQSMHQSSVYRVNRVFNVEIGSMRRDFETQGKATGNIMELWHGTQVGNLLSIIKSGLKLSPPRTAHIAGKMFGNGLYFSDQSTKSLNYASGYWGGSGGSNRIFMLLNHVAMGKPFTPDSYTSCSGWTSAKAGYDSTFAIGGKSGVMNNEMIVYRESQANPVYLVEFVR